MATHTPQGQLIADAVTNALIPEPWATFVREGLMIVAQQQSDVRHRQIEQGVGISLIGTFVGLLAYRIVSEIGVASAAA
ncbi:MAG: hypothetical protein ACREQM_11000 [Candidatus Dormibacteraceae bacterium]